MKTSRFKTEFRANASKLHRKVGEILRTSRLFSGFKIYQEYPISRINPEYTNNAHKFDWVILDLHLVIECHGEQHYRPVAFGGMDAEQAVENYMKQRHRDDVKMDAAIEVGFTYVVVPYTDYKTVDLDYIWSRFKALYNDKPLQEVEVKQESEYDVERKRKAKEARQAEYQRKKEWRDKMIKEGNYGPNR